MNTRTNQLLGDFDPDDDAARNVLIERTAERLQRLIRQRFGRQDKLRRDVDTNDIFQGVVLRLCRALRECRPANAGEFFRLSATMIRRELIDLRRHFHGKHGRRARRDTDAGLERPRVEESPDAEGTDPGDDAARRELLGRMDELVDTLEPELRDAVDLLTYQGLSYDEAAAVIGVSSRTVRRRERDAQVVLHAALGK